jgi:Rrf2 family iron-sulfur cluster assembly transcriptional regulator
VVLSRTAEHALRSVLYLARSNGGGRLTAARIAEELAVPANYMAKTLNRLVKAGVLDSTRGPRGGFALAVPAGELSLADVVGAFDRLDGPDVCMLDGERCGSAEPCAAHRQWERVTGDVHRVFRDTTIADLLES